jgi:hypothetical protein
MGNTNIQHSQHKTSTTQKIRTIRTKYKYKFAQYKHPPLTSDALRLRWACQSPVAHAPQQQMDLQQHLFPSVGANQPIWREQQTKELKLLVQIMFVCLFVYV